MLSLIFPKQLDNNYRGHWLGILLLVPLALMKLAQSVVSIVMTRMVATGPDRIPLDSYDPAAADAVVSIFALLGLYGLIVPVLALIALVRYRSMIPLVYLFFLAVQVGSRVLITLNPIVRSDGPATGFGINMAILAVTVVGFGLSLWRRSGSTREAPSTAA